MAKKESTLRFQRIWIDTALILRSVLSARFQLTSLARNFRLVPSPRPARMKNRLRVEKGGKNDGISWRILGEKQRNEVKVGKRTNRIIRLYHTTCKGESLKKTRAPWLPVALERRCGPWGIPVLRQLRTRGCVINKPWEKNLGHVKSRENGMTRTPSNSSTESHQLLLKTHIQPVFLHNHWTSKDFAYAW